ncbi:histidine phosphatase family protein [Saccharothrix longispora]|uniref:histidine phosphatase family protein n=1 Tax=Saccharothrix longispora TaxID=33920 RepID=UPI0028FD1DD9|nr:histidine phosphatase family protein [Saccharothrix longispora]MBY8850968.1 histidine phosphatase family protein [Saccharothrix sp. MB29]MDU0289009.1 histidine phosphatase family protein [Saccharothrix longispora]
MATDLVLVRHATSVVPTRGGPDEMTRPLRPEGLVQARDLVGGLLALAPTAVASSPYLRAVQTVEPAARALGLAVDTRWELREWDSGLAPTPDYARHHVRSWEHPDEARPGAESIADLDRRVGAALARLAEEHDGGTVLVGTHGTFAARALLAAGAAGRLAVPRGHAHAGGPRGPVGRRPRGDRRPRTGATP